MLHRLLLDGAGQLSFLLKSAAGLQLGDGDGVPSCLKIQEKLQEAEEALIVSSELKRKDWKQEKAGKQKQCSAESCC